MIEHALQPERSVAYACISFHRASPIRDISKPVNWLTGFKHRQNRKTGFEK